MRDTQKVIIDAAKELFSKKGYAAVRTKEIAILAGVNEATLFRHFKSKRELFENIIIMNIQAVDSNDLFHKKVTGNPSNDLIMIATQLFMLYKANAQIIKMIMKDIIDDGDTIAEYASECRGGHIKKYIIQYFKELKNRHVIDDDPILLAELFMSCINGYLFNAFILEDREADLDYLKLMTKKFILIINFIDMEG